MILRTFRSQNVGHVPRARYGESAIGKVDELDPRQRVSKHAKSQNEPNKLLKTQKIKSDTMPDANECMKTKLLIANFPIKPLFSS